MVERRPPNPLAGVQFPHRPPPRASTSLKNMFKSQIEALEKLGREIKRLEESEDRDNVIEIDFNDCHDSVFNTAVTGWHVIDWTFQNDPSISDNDKTNKETFGKFRKDREKDCPELSLCGDIANKVKHAEITRPRTSDGRTDMETTGQTFIGMEISEKGIRTSVQKCAILLNGERAVDVFIRVFDYWSDYLKSYTDVKLEKPHKPLSKQSSSLMRIRAGGYYCSTCRTATGMLIPHSDTCNTCGNPYQDIPK